MYEEKIIEELIKIKLSQKESPRELGPDPYMYLSQSETIVSERGVNNGNENGTSQVESVVSYNTPRSTLKVLLTLELSDYKNIQSEMRVFIDKNKNKKFNIYVIYYNPHQLAWEYVYKVKPIIQFILMRNLHPLITDRMTKVLTYMDNLGIDKYIREVSNGGDYNKSIYAYKLEQLLGKHENDLRDIVLFMFNAQPIKQRQVSQQTVGMGQNEFDDMTHDEDE